MFVDSHAHLFSEEFEKDIHDVVSRAADAGVDAIISPGTDLETSRKAIRLAETYEMIYACVGFHPHEASRADDASLEEIERLSDHPKVVAIGEIGLDFHYDYSPPDRQKEIFARQIDIAIRTNLPIVIHSREAEEFTLEIVRRKLGEERRWRADGGGNSLPRGVFHCFPGDERMASAVIGWGFLISIPGLVTFGSRPGKPNTMAEVVARISMDHILLETDSPYLTPVPHRGKRNEPAHLPLIAAKIAEIQKLPIEEVARASTAASRTLFRLRM